MRAHAPIFMQSSEQNCNLSFFLQIFDLSLKLQHQSYFTANYYLAII